MPNPASVEPVEVGHFIADVTAGPTSERVRARLALLVSDGEGGVAEESLHPDADARSRRR